jgi:hypothetical protein
VYQEKRLIERWVLFLGLIPQDSEPATRHEVAQVAWFGEVNIAQMLRIEHCERKSAAHPAQ